MKDWEKDGHLFCIISHFKSKRFHLNCYIPLLLGETNRTIPCKVKSILEANISVFIGLDLAENIPNFRGKWL